MAHRTNGTFWVSRDRTDPNYPTLSPSYITTSSRPARPKGNLNWEGKHLNAHCSIDWELTTGLKLLPGTRVQAQMSVIKK